MRLAVRTFTGTVLVAFCLAFPGLASAQSAITGLVRDTTGAILPGVTIEASSDVLIEKVRAATTDPQGRYTIVDLRPGVYTVTFTLTGFNTLRHEKLELPANFTATVNADLRVGALEESITVTGDAPVVDVQSTQRTTVLNRELLDAVPSARNYSGLAALMPGVRQSNSDVGGNQQMEQIYMTTHGSRQTDTTVQVDGMTMNSLMNGGQVQAYFSDAANAEVSFQTSGAGADVSGGGVRINMIPKEGGNRFSGSAFVGGSDGDWQSDNVTQELRDRGLQSGDRVAHITDFNFALGGPIKRDRLWFFATWRRISTDEVVANAFYDDGSPAIEDQWIQNQMVRLTWQMNAKNKLTAYHDRYPKFKGHELGPRTDPARASSRRDPEHALYYTGQVKWTSTVTGRLLLEAGYATNMEYLLISNQPGIAKERGTPEWYSNTRHVDRLLSTNRNSGPLENGIYPSKYVISSAASYVTGSHNFRAGMQWGFGNYRTSYNVNGDLYQYYDNGAPSLVLVYNTPIYQQERLNADLGIFAQDSWTFRRLTTNVGVRYEHFNAEIRQQGVPAGRFVPARELQRMENMPNWKDITPRLGASFDLFGNARTAIKASANKYMAGQTTDFPARYNPNALQFEFRSWADRNGDNIAQDEEIGTSANANFGRPVQTIRPEEGIEREYDWVYNAGIQHEVMRGLGVSFNYYRRSTHDMRVTQNTLVSLDDYTPVEIYNPLDGSPITIYNLALAKFGQVDRIDRTSTDSDRRQRVFNAYEVSFNARFGNAMGFGAYTIDRSLSVYCDGSNAGATLNGTVATDPNTFRFCDDRQNGIPFRHEVKFAGSYMLPYEVQVNAAFQSYTGNESSANWALSRTTRYPANCPSPCPAGAVVVPSLTVASLTVPLIQPGSRYLPRHNQLDFGVRKLFRLRNIQLSAQVDVFNLNNSSRVNSEITAFGPSLHRPSTILQPRTVRLATQVRF